MRFFSFRRHFLHSLFVLVIPIVIQNLITTSVSLADVVMLGRVNQTVLSAASLAGQVQFILNMVYFGVASALIILAAQYWGKGDRRTIGKILGIGLIVSMTVSTFFCLFALIAPGRLIRLWTSMPGLVDAGKDYLRFVALSYFFSGITQPYLAVMKSCGRVRLPMVISIIALVVNIGLNAVLIFGLFGLPALGIRGAAIATSAARGVELGVCIFDFCRQKIITHSLRDIFAIPRELVHDFILYCLPAFIEDVIWGLASNMTTVIMGHLNADIVAANSVVTVVRNLITTFGYGISSAAAIILGNTIGSGRLPEAKEEASEIVRACIIVSVIEGAFLLAISPIVLAASNLTARAAGYLRIMLFINSVYQFGQLLNTVLIASIFRCGGKTKVGLIMDIFCMWCYMVPVGLLAAFVWKLPPIIVYTILCTDEFAKLPYAVHYYRSRKWLSNITREFA